MTVVLNKLPQIRNLGELAWYSFGHAIGAAELSDNVMIPVYPNMSRHALGRFNPS